MAKIDRVEDLPDWFDLNNYAGSESFSAANWTSQLDRRRKLFDGHPDYPIESLHGKNTDEYMLELVFWRGLKRGCAEQIRQFPLTFHPSLPSVFVAKDWKYIDYIPVNCVSFHTLRLQLDRDFTAVLESKAPKTITDRWSLLCPDTVKVQSGIDYGPITLTEYDDRNTDSSVISVDLGATDSVLIESFEAWLKRARIREKDANKQTSKRNRPAYKDWSRYGLLPYLDLLLWAYETDNHIPRRVFSAAVSHFDRGESAFSKVVVPLARQLMINLTELQALASAELYAKKK